MYLDACMAEFSANLADWLEFKQQNLLWQQANWSS